jgi:hypothetical protein
VNELYYEINVRAADGITNETLANSRLETQRRLDVCCTTNGIDTEIYRPLKEPFVVQCLKMYLFLQDTLWLKIYNVSFYFHLRPGILY